MGLFLAFFNSPGDWLFVAGMIALAVIVSVFGWARKKWIIRQRKRNISN